MLMTHHQQDGPPLFRELERVVVHGSEFIPGEILPFLMSVHLTTYFHVVLGDEHIPCQVVDLDWRSLSFLSEQVGTGQVGTGQRVSAVDIYITTPVYLFLISIITVPSA